MDNNFNRKSPGVYSTVKDNTFTTATAGVSSIGLVGETTIGPAFQPIFISNWEDFKTYFGGTNATLVKETGYPQYELPYIALKYFSEANALFVTRVLGLSGYDAGLAWGITLDSALDDSTVVVTNTGTTYSPLISYTATSAGTIVTLVSTDAVIQTLINNSDSNLLGQLSTLGVSNTGVTFSVTTPIYYKTGTSFSGVSFNLTVTASNYPTNGTGIITGITTGITVQYSGTVYSEIENQLVALLRSRASVDLTSQLPKFEVSASTNLGFSTIGSTSQTNPKGKFYLTGVSTTQGAFNYALSLDSSSIDNDYLPGALGRNNDDKKTAIFVEEFFPNMLKSAIADNKVRGVKQSLVQYGDSFKDYFQQFQPATTPWVVSELRGNKVLRLFRFVTISDGNAANEQFKISITNIDPTKKTFNVIVRGFDDDDSNFSALDGDSYTNCTMDKASNNYIGRKIGTVDGNFAAVSKRILVEFDESTDTNNAYPAGFVGYPIRDYQSNSQTTVANPDLTYKQTYAQGIDNLKKVSLGISSSIGVDADFFDYKGVPQTTSPDVWTGMTNGFHMDVDASAVTIDKVYVVINSSGGTYSPIFKFDTGNWQFRNPDDFTNGPYETAAGRKFTFVPYGGFDGWDEHRDGRSNSDRYTLNGSYGVAGFNNGETFKKITLSNGSVGLNSDYYAYLEAIWTFKNPEATNINIFATPGIDCINHTNLIEETIEMIESDRADSLYVMTTPDNVDDTDLTATEITNQIDGLFDSSFTCTYWPWIQLDDVDNNIRIWTPPTCYVIADLARNDAKGYPWYAAAGVNRGDVGNNDGLVQQARKVLTQGERDTLYEGRINPIATFEGNKYIWGNKTLQIADSALNRVNVRRLLLEAIKLVTAVGRNLLFEQNDAIVRNQFLSQVNPILDNIRAKRGLYDFRVVLSNSPEDFDRNQLTGKIYLKPTKVLEFIEMEFNVMNYKDSFQNQ
jgi:hypothetical protein